MDKVLYISKRGCVRSCGLPGDAVIKPVTTTCGIKSVMGVPTESNPLKTNNDILPVGSSGLKIISAKGSGAATTYVVSDSKIQFTVSKVGGSVAWRTNNPGNIMAGGVVTGIGVHTNKLSGATYRYVIFSNPVVGFEKLKGLLSDADIYPSEMSLDDFCLKYPGPDGEKLYKQLAMQMGLAGTVGSVGYDQLSALISKAEGWAEGSIELGTSVYSLEFVKEELQW